MQTVRLHKNVRVMLCVLEKQNLHTAKQDTELFAEYIDSLENELKKVRNELQGMKKQVDAIQNRGVKSAIRRIVHDAEVQIAKAKTELAVIRRDFIRGAGLVVRAAKDQGIQGLHAAVEKLHLQEGLARLKNLFHQCVEHIQNGIDRLAALAGELHEAGVHAKNAGRALRGKTPADITSRDTDRGVIHGLQVGLARIGSHFAAMEQHTGKTLESIGRLRERAEAVSRRPSLRQELRAMQRDHDAPKTRAREKAGREK